MSFKTLLLALVFVLPISVDLHAKKKKGNRKGAQQEAVELPEIWKHDLKEALALAKAQNKKVYAVFAGSDWCLPCRKLSAGVLSQKEFIETMSKEYVLCEIDNPRSEEAIAALGEEKAAKNQAAATEYNIKVYPTAVVLNADGTEITRIKGGHSGEIKIYTDRIARFVNNANLRKAFQAKAEEGDKDAQFELDVIKATKAIYLSTSLVRGGSITIGGKKKVGGDHQEPIDNEAKLLYDHYVAGKTPTYPPSLFGYYYGALYHSVRSGEVKRSKALLKLVKENPHPETAVAQRFTKLVETLEAQTETLESNQKTGAVPGRS